MKIGITIDMSLGFWANGMQQNIVFLYSLLNAMGNDCYYITFKKPKYILNKSHKGMMLSDVIDDKKEVFDVIFCAGFDLIPEMYEELKKRNPKLKIILIHFGNKLMDDIHYSVCAGNTKRVPLEKPAMLDEIWMANHHSFSKEYIKAYYNHENVKIMPYIWDPFFLQDRIQHMQKKSLNPFFCKEDKFSVCIFEPNISHIKNSIVPIMACERFLQLFEDKMESINVFCAEKLRDNEYFKKYIKRLSLFASRDFIYFNNRWSSLDAMSKFGKFIISHQIDNEMNYAQLEALYLGNPIIHNSKELCDVGYYYKNHDVSMAAKQMYCAFKNHTQVFEEYKNESRAFLQRYSPYSQNNISQYKKMLECE
jgi:hypothetical protein